MGVIPHGKTEAQGRKGQKGKSADNTGLKAGHSFTISGSGETNKKSGLAGLTGRGKQ